MTSTRSRCPAGITEDETTVTLTVGGSPVEYTYAEALALDSATLEAATAIEIAFRSADGSAVIPTNGTGTVGADVAAARHRALDGCGR